jgi:hypothetical protein
MSVKNYEEKYELRMRSNDGKGIHTTLYDNSKEAFVAAYVAEQEAVIINTRYRLLEMVNPDHASGDGIMSEDIGVEINNEYPGWSHGAADLEHNYVPLYGRTENNKDLVDVIKIKILDGPSEAELLKSFMLKFSYSNVSDSENGFGMRFKNRNGVPEQRDGVRVLELRQEREMGEGWYFVEIRDGTQYWQGYYNANTKKGDLKSCVDYLDTSKDRFVDLLLLDERKNSEALKKMNIAV